MLGHAAENLHQDRDPNLYNDYDFYQILLGDFLQANEDADANSEEGSQDEDQEKHYLGNADLNLTRKAIAKKKAMKPAPKKDVDRRASKNRKIKYVVHDKILNFMPSRENLILMEGRTAVVSNLFGKRIDREQNAKKRRRQPSDDAIQLI